MRMMLLAIARWESMEANRQVLHSDLSAITAEFKEYAYTVSHDLNAPVRAMVEFSRMLTSEYNSALNYEAREYLSIIIENGERMQAMMDGLLSYSRLNTMAKSFCLVNLSRIVEDCRIIKNACIIQSGATLDIGELPTVKVDVDQMMQLFLALFDNALKFYQSGSKPHITVSAEPYEGMWKISIADNNIGIPPQHRERVFKLFKRLHSDEEYEGVGIGLALADKIVRRHGGKIWVESNFPQGSIFNFTLGGN
jgi:light-regulated signal transduction histidine kinase (bacteriophytochrome)